MEFVRKEGRWELLGRQPAVSVIKSLDFQPMPQPAVLHSHFFLLLI